MRIPPNDPITARFHNTNGAADQTIKTIKLIGQAIKQGSVYPPIILHARKLAVRAEPKDYRGQVQHIYDDFVKNWRYTYDPVGLETIATSPKALFRLVIAGDGIGLGEGRGGGDCDEAVAAIGALCRAVGFDVRLATTSPIGAPPEFPYSHIFPQIHLGVAGWVTVDPVLYPKKRCGYAAPYSKIGYWNLDGELIEHNGGVPRYLKREVSRMFGTSDLIPSYALSGTTAPVPDDWREMISGFGAYVETMGYSDGSNHNFLVEAAPDENGLARTPMLEFAADDYEYLRYRGNPYHEMLALGDNGELYEYDGNLGFFKKLKRRAKKGARRLARGAGRGVKRFVKKLPGGKALVRLGRKLLKVSMKLVKPLAKYVGKYAKYLAPVAALIPGIGPAVAAGMYTAGKVAKLMDKYGVKFLPGPKGVKKLDFKSKDQARAFQKALKVEAAKEKAKQSLSGADLQRRFKRPVRGTVLRVGTPAHAAFLKGL